ncbi:unnamed protein product [Amoebophrya sp. A25]|nr:unnamed protein product [Amoebophrya sp. A25]|eukprot:GSA25T00001666001.1
MHPDEVHFNRNKRIRERGLLNGIQLRGTHHGTKWSSDKKNGTASVSRLTVNGGLVDVGDVSTVSYYNSTSSSATSRSTTATARTPLMTAKLSSSYATHYTNANTTGRNGASSSLELDSSTQPNPLLRPGHLVHLNKPAAAARAPTSDKHRNETFLRMALAEATQRAAAELYSRDIHHEDRRPSREGIEIDEEEGDDTGRCTTETDRKKSCLDNSNKNENDAEINVKTNKSVDDQEPRSPHPLDATSSPSPKSSTTSSPSPNNKRQGKGPFTLTLTSSPADWVCFQIQRIKWQDPDLLELDLSHIQFPENEPLLLPTLLEALKEQHDQGAGGGPLVQGERSSLRLLSLRGCQLGRFSSRGIKKAFLEMLEENETLECLDLESNSLSPDFLIGIAEALYSNETLRELKLSGNGAGINGSADTGNRAVVQAFAHLLEENWTLIRLGLDVTDPTCRHKIDRAQMRNLVEWKKNNGGRAS